MRTIPMPAALCGALILCACASDSPPTDAVLGSGAHPPAPAFSHEMNQQLAALRAHTAPFHNLDKAMEAGYDIEITGCLDDAAIGGMGFHYTKSSVNLIDGNVDLLEPELLVYSPRRNGSLRFSALEYVVPFDAWSDPGPPALLGQQFHAHPVLPIWILHVWLWQHNPLGMFADFNPDVPLC